jgi:predicted TIM-barrel fold metal-dependent hydrolase
MSERLALGSATLFFDNARVLGNLLYSGILERFPKVKVVSVESGIGWIPFLLETLDYEAQETGSYKNGKLKMLPSEYFRRQVYGCFWFETNAPQKLIQDVGVNNVLFETDFPHPTCLYPNNRNHLQKAMGHLDENICRRVLQDNAAELYRIPLPG